MHTRATKGELEHEDINTNIRRLPCIRLPAILTNRCRHFNNTSSAGTKCILPWIL